MAKYDQMNLTFAAYEDATEFLGIAEATLPNLDAITQTINGAGVMGSVEAVAIGFYNAMTLVLNFRSSTDETMKLAEPRKHNLELRVARQTRDNVTGEIDVGAVKHVFVVMPKSTSGGTITPASTSGGSGQYAVESWMTYVDGNLVLAVDPYNHICTINGVDYGEKIRKALGK